MMNKIDWLATTTEDLIATISNEKDRTTTFLGAVKEFARRTGGDWRVYNPALAYRLNMADAAQARAEENHS